MRFARLNRFKPSSKLFYWRFQGGTSFADLLCFVLSCVCYVFVRVCLCVLCGHLLGKSWFLGSRLWCLTVSLSLSHWYPGSGMVLDCIVPDLRTLTYFTLHMKLATVIAQINRYTYFVCWLTRIQLLAFIPSRVPVVMWNVRVSVVSVNSSSLNHHIYCLCWFIDQLETSTWAIQMHVLEPHRTWG